MGLPESTRTGRERLTAPWRSLNSLLLITPRQRLKPLSKRLWHCTRERDRCLRLKPNNLTRYVLPTETGVAFMPTTEKTALQLRTVNTSHGFVVQNFLLIK